MTIIKSYTDIEQSKKLAEILSHESADMYWYLVTKGNPKAMFNEGYNEYGDFELPCWSLVALLKFIPNVEIKSKIQNFNSKSWCISSHDDKNYNYTYVYNDNLLDAAYSMILMLHEQKLL